MTASRGVDVGRSCILVSIGGKRIMFDCGMHMGYQDERRFPDFSYISREKNFTSMLDAVIITHLYEKFSLVQSNGPAQPPRPLRRPAVLHGDVRLRRPDLHDGARNPFKGHG